METAKQLSVQLVNKPGRLAGVCTALAKQKINIRALAVMDSGELSTLRFLTDRPEETQEVLDRLGHPYEVDEVLLVELPNRPGSLARICERLAAEHINIEYAYASASRTGGKAVGVFKVSNAARAQRLLAEVATTKRQPTGRRPMHAR